MAYTVEYPRPDFTRPTSKWEALDGAWDFLFDDKDVGLSEKWYSTSLPADSASATDGEKHAKCTIKVPFAFQTPASGVFDRGAHEVVWYQRTISDIRPDAGKGRLLLRFGAVDYEASVWVDGKYYGGHKGGHVPFDVDITAACGEGDKMTVTVRVRDSPYDIAQPRGKQYWKPEPESIWYTPTSGIWQSVWLECVPDMWIGDGSYGTILRAVDIEKGSLYAKVTVVSRPAGSKCAVEVETSFLGVPVAKAKAELPKEKEFAILDVDLRLSPEAREKISSEKLNGAAFDNENAWRDGLALWSPDHPQLYDITLRLFGPDDQLVDEVSTYTGLRSLSWTTGDGTFRLNGKPFFQALVLDQGYWPETGLTPPSQGSLKADIEMSQKMGFNGCRKHQKVEDPIFLYWADKLGYVVWGEMANAYDFSEEYVESFDQEWLESVKRDINHPCIVTWTPGNESWGYPSLKDNIPQRNHLRSLYYKTKTLDPTRPINDNCGWETVITDLTTFHDYADGPELEKTCSTMEGILSPKAERDMFVPAIDSAAGKDPGSKHTVGAPVLCTEFGGVNIAPAAGDAAAGAKDWGYTTASDPEDLLKRLDCLFMAVVKGSHCCGLVYTQLTDVEQEVNGLYSFDRRAKVDVARMKGIMDAAVKFYYDNVAKA